MLLGHEDLRNFRSPSYLSSGFALELGDKSVEARLVGLNANNGKELLDIGSGGGGVATGLEEEVCSNVTHLKKKTGARGQPRPEIISLIPRTLSF